MKGDESPCSAARLNAKIDSVGPTAIVDSARARARTRFEG